MTDSRIRKLAPVVMQCASELSTLWPVRPKWFGASAAKDVSQAA